MVQPADAMRPVRPAERSEASGPGGRGRPARRGQIPRCPRNDDGSRSDDRVRTDWDAAALSITLGVDGRLYCHDIVRELLPVLASLCGPDAKLVERVEAEQRWNAREA